MSYHIKGQNINSGLKEKKKVLDLLHESIVSRRKPVFLLRCCKKGNKKKKKRKENEIVCKRKQLIIIIQIQHIMSCREKGFYVSRQMGPLGTMAR